MAGRIRVAACHASAVFLSAKGTTEKAISSIERASRNKANLVVFPETFIPAFPVWSAIRPPTENHKLFQDMAHQSIYADGPEMHALRATAKKTNSIVSIGISEKVRYSSACLFNSNIIIGPDGNIMVHHRKLMPTFFEKLTWSHGDGFGLRVADTPFGKIGNLICGENTNPLARYALMAQGEQLHISTWPAIWPTRVPEALAMEEKIKNSEEGSKRGPANYDNVTANRTRAAAHCFEAKCFGVLCSGLLDDAAKDLISEGASRSADIRNILNSSPNGATMFLDPTGALLPGYTIDAVTGKKTSNDFLQNAENILYADMDFNDCVEGKQYHDVVGGYQRLDIFDVKVDRRRRKPAKFVDEDSAASQEGVD